MKNRISVVAGGIAAVLVGLICLLPTWAAANGGNMIPNPSVEQANPDDPTSPLGFSKYIRKGDKANKSMEWAEVGRTGKMGLSSEAEGGYGVIKIPMEGELDPDALYRYSFWYKTESKDPVGRAISIYATPVDFRYPTATQWTQAHLFFLGKECTKGFEVYVKGFHGGRLEYQKGEDGKDILDEKGRKIVENQIKVTACIDDFQLRKAREEDYQGNLLENGDFEKGTVTHMAPGWWNVYNPDESIGALDDQVFHSGKQSLRMNCEIYNMMCTNRVPVRPGDICTYSIWAKSDVPDTPFILRVYTNGKKKYTGEQWSLEERFTIGTEWRKLEVIMEIPGKDSPHYDPSTSYAQCYLRYPMKGSKCTIWVDDASFVRESL